MDDAIGALADLSLVDFHPDKRTFSVHRLVQAAARDALGDTAPAMVAQRAAGRALGISGARVQDLAAVRALGRPRPRRGGTGDRGQQGAGLAARHDRRLSSRARCARRGPPALRANPGHLRAPGAGRSRQRRLAARPLGQLRARSATCSARGAISTPRSRPIRTASPSAEKLAAQDPSNTELAARPLGQLHRIGDVQRARGNLDAALKAYQDSLAIAREAGRAGPEQHRLAARPLGQLRAGSATCSARGAISTPRSRPIRTASPSPRSWPRRTRATPSGSATSRSASTRSATCRARGAISTPRSRPIRTASPSARSWPRRTRATPSWQRDLSVSFNKIGDVQSARGNLDAALKAYQDSLAIPEKLAAQDPSNAELAARPLGQLRARSATCRARRAISTPRSRPIRTSLAIREKLAAQDPSNAEWQRDVWVSMWRFAQMEGSGVSWAEVLARMEAMKARGVLLPTDEPFLEQARTLAAATRPAWRPDVVGWVSEAQPDDPLARRRRPSWSRRR